MANLHHFLRSVSPNDLRQHLEQSGIPVPANLNWDASAEEFSKGFLKAVEQLSEQDLVQLLADIDRITDMTDEVGQAALLSLVDWRERLKAMDSAYHRAHWLYRELREAFRQAEEIRYADENQNAQRLWDGFVGPRCVDLKTDPKTMEQFKSILIKELTADRLHIELFGRIRTRAGEPDRDIWQLTVYSADVPIDEIVFATVGVKNQARKPVRETAIVYEPSSGTIEIVGRIKAIREKIACLFAEKLLGIEISGERLPPRRVDLSPLLDPHNFTVDPKDRIARVKLTMLTVSTFGGTLTQRFEVPFSDDKTLHEVLDEEHGAGNPLRKRLRPWMARIEIQFEPENGRKSGKKINVILCAPKRCNLRGKTEKERLLLNRYLKAWGLLRGDEA